MTSVESASVSRAWRILSLGLQALEHEYELWLDAHKSLLAPSISDREYVDPIYLGIDVEGVEDFRLSLSFAKTAVESRQVPNLVQAFNDLIRYADGLTIPVKFSQWDLLNRGLRVLQSISDVAQPDDVLFLPPAIGRSHADAARGARRNPASLVTMTPRQFEETVAGLFHLEGFQVALTPPSRDKGFDIIAVQRILGVPFKWIVECKRYTRDLVTAPTVQKLFGAATGEHADRALVVTTTGFTRDAREFARRNPILQLWSRSDLLAHLETGAV